jgi:hypothetical protein
VQDIPTRETSFRTTGGAKVELKRDYPLSRLVAELVKIEGDRIVRTEGVAAFLPYRMPTPWSAKER